MNTGIIALSVVPGRKEPNDRSEMVTQLLFGEEYRILEEKENWVKIKGNADDYECWIDKKQHLENAPSELVITTRSIGDYWLNTDTNEMISLNPGSLIREEPTFHPSFAGEIELVLQVEDEDTIAHICYQFLNAPYLWGGKTSLGIDCSGLTQVVMRAMDYNLPRDAYQQALHGKAVSNIDQAQEGDLAFFSSANSKEDKITHVGIILAEGWIIHASGWVRLDRIDEQGILNVNTETYSHRLIEIRRILS